MLHRHARFSRDHPVAASWFSCCFVLDDIFHYLFGFQTSKSGKYIGLRSVLNIGDHLLGHVGKTVDSDRLLYHASGLQNSDQISFDRFSLFSPKKTSFVPGKADDSPGRAYIHIHPRLVQQRGRSTQPASPARLTSPPHSDGDERSSWVQADTSYVRRGSLRSYGSASGIRQGRPRNLVYGRRRKLRSPKSDGPNY